MSTAMVQCLRWYNVQRKGEKGAGVIIRFSCRIIKCPVSGGHARALDASALSRVCSSSVA